MLKRYAIPLFSVSLLSTIGCASSVEEPPATPASEESANAESETTLDASLAEEPSADTSSEEGSGKWAPPRRCEGGGSNCLPPRAFVSKLCKDIYGDVALQMFAPTSPWQRVYLNRVTDAVNGSGGVTLDGKLQLGEEVLVLRRSGADAGGMQVSGSESLDALRWDGSCVTLYAEEVNETKPSSVKYGPVSWRALGDEVLDVLKEDEKVFQSYLARRNECKGATMGEVSRKCETLDKQLSQEIVDYVRRGGTIPSPVKHP